MNSIRLMHSSLSTRVGAPTGVTWGQRRRRLGKRIVRSLTRVTPTRSARRRRRNRSLLMDEASWMAFTPKDRD